MEGLAWRTSQWQALGGGQSAGRASSLRLHTSTSGERAGMHACSRRAAPTNHYHPCRHHGLKGVEVWLQTFAPGVGTPVHRQGLPCWMSPLDEGSYTYATSMLC